jgi:hypothetical protein
MSEKKYECIEGQDYLVLLTVFKPDFVSMEDFREWVQYETGYRSRVSHKNPLSNIHMIPRGFTIKDD